MRQGHSRGQSSTRRPGEKWNGGSLPQGCSEAKAGGESLWATILMEKQHVRTVTGEKLTVQPNVNMGRGAGGPGELGISGNQGERKC